MSDQKTVVRTHFDRYASGWHDRLQDHPFLIRFLGVKELVVSVPSTTVVDVGCGTGDYCQLFTPSNYVGLDISPSMIDECRRLYPAYRFDVADGDSLTLPDLHADLVLDIAVIEYYDDPLPHMKEMNRVLQVGGTLIVAVPNATNVTRGVNVAYNRFVRRVKRALGRPPEATRDKDPRIAHRNKTVAQMRALGAATGFDLVRWNYVNVMVLPEAHRLIGQLNRRISFAISRRTSWRWLSRYCATITICQMTKR